MNPVITTEQIDFDFIVPMRKELLTVNEVAEILRFHPDTVYEMILLGELLTHRRAGSGKTHQRVLRSSLIAHLAKSAQYDTEQRVETVLALAKTLSPKHRREIGHKLLQS